MNPFMDARLVRGADAQRVWVIWFGLIELDLAAGFQALYVVVAGWFLWELRKDAS